MPEVAASLPVLALAFIVGLVIGSFLNVVGLRFLADESVINPPSHCPGCKTRLAAVDNIPVLSYILLGGQCRTCKIPISVQYPLIELATGLLFALTVWYFGLSLQTLLLLFLICNLVVIFITDLRESLIFQINSLSLIPAGLLYNLLNLGEAPGTLSVNLGHIILHIPEALVSALIAIAIAVVFFEGMILVSNLVFGTEGFGHGDTHLMMGAGAFLGWQMTVLALVLGFVIQTIPAIPMLIWQWIRNRQWGPLISGGAAMLFGLLPFVFMNSGLSANTAALLSLGGLVLSMIALFVFLKQVKTAQSFTYLPLGPALVIGSLVALFWGPELLQAYFAALR